MEFGASFYPLAVTVRILGYILFSLNRTIKRLDHQPRVRAVTVSVTHAQLVPPLVRCCVVGKAPGDRSCQTAISILTFPCFQQHRVGHDVLQLHVDGVWGYTAADRAPGPPRRLQSQFVPSKHRPPPPPTAQPGRKISTLRLCSPVRTPPHLFLLLFLLLLPSSLRPEAAATEEEETDSSLCGKAAF